MNIDEERIYKDIKNELIQSSIDKKIDTYFTNKNELSHYYNVGKMIVDAEGGKEKTKYGNELIKKISKRLTSELGKGYSWRNLYNMRLYYFFCINNLILQPVVAKLNWTQITILINIKDINEINYYVEEINRYHWSKRELQKHIKNKDYQRLNIETKNKLIQKEKTNIYDLIKNPIYINTYNNEKEDISEIILQKYILKDMNNFLKQLGNGFAYVDHEYKIKIGNTFNYIDLLLYNIIYNCYVIVELKVTESKKDHLGQIMVYINYVDKYLKNINQDKTIGIIVCKIDNKYLIEYSSDERIKVTTYELI